MSNIKHLLKLALMSGSLFCCFTVTAQQTSDRIKSIYNALPELDNMFQLFAKRNQLPGFVYGLVVDGQLMHTSQFGLANVKNKTAVTDQSAFRIASMTKSFTAMAILQLRDSGKLKLDDPAYYYLPEMEQQQYTSTDAPPVTIRHLLTHAAGFPEDNPWGDRQLAITTETMLKMIKKGVSFSNTPGVSYEYSNLGFAMLGYIITTVSGIPYQQFINERILAPLGMKHTYWDYEVVPQAELAMGYRIVNNELVPQPMLRDGAYGAMGGLITSMEDFSKYVALHQNAWPARSDPDNGPIKRSSIREMHQPWNINSLLPSYQYPGGRPCPMVTAYGYGLRWTRDCDNKSIIGHSGGLPGFGSDWKMLADYGIGIISFGNLTYTSAGLFNTMALDTLLKLAHLQRSPVPVSKVLQQRKEELVQLLPNWNKAVTSGIFAENFFLDYFVDDLQKQATALFKKAGKIVKVHELVPVNNLRGSFIIEGEHAAIQVWFTLSPENPPLIQEYQVREVEKPQRSE